MPTTLERGQTQLRHLLLVIMIVCVATIGCKKSSSKAPIAIAPPLISADEVVTDEDTAIVIAPLLNDQDPQGESLGLVSVTLPSNGTVVINPDGTLTYTPDLDFNGVDRFGYTAANTSGVSSEGGIEVLVLAVNDSPLAGADSAIVDEDNSVDIDVLANDSDVEDPTLVISNFSQGANGAVIPASGMLRYTPLPDFSGSDSFTYTVVDGEGGEATATVSIDVTPINDPPVLVPDFVTLDEDAVTVIAVLDNDSDVDGDTLEVLKFGLRPRAGNAVINSDSTITYTPNSEFAGSDAFTYVVTDGTVSGMAAVSITINRVNDLPVVVDDQAFTTEDVGVVINVLANDFDIEGSPLTIVGVTPPTLGSVVIQTGGNIAYTPNANASGTDSFQYTVSDGVGVSTGTVTITISPVNDPPVAFNDMVTTLEDTPVTFSPLANDQDPDGTPLMILGTPRPAAGNVTVNGDGTLTYSPGLNFNGTDSFTYSITDGTLNSTATIVVQVTSVNDVPLPQPDNAFTTEDVALPIQLNVLANDVDLDRDPLLVSSISPAANGVTALLNPINGLASLVTYKPNANFFGTDSFTYTVTDQNGGTAQASVTVMVTSVDDPPVAQGDAVNTNEDTPVTILVLANDIEIDGENLTIIGTTTPANGTLQINVDGSITYTPALNYFGTDTFVYTIADDSGSQDSATVAILVASVNDDPIALGDITTTMEDHEVLVPILDNDFDPDGDTLTIVGFNPPANGNATIVNGKMMYVPDLNFFGTDVFNYTVTDGNGGSATERAVVLVSEVNDAPVALDDAVNTAEDMAVLISPLINDTDVDGDPLQITGTTLPSNGLLQVNTDGTLLYTPPSNFAGSATFEYTVGDGRGGSDSAQVTVTIQRTNDAPQGMNDIATTNEDVAVTIAVLANDSDPDGDPLTVTSVSATASGTAIVNGDNTITYSPDANFNGQDSFTYTVEDGVGGIDVVTVTVDVLPVNDAPVANDDAASTLEDQPVTINILANDTDADGEPLTLSAVTPPANGTVVMMAGAVLYTPALNYFGTDGFTYTITDGAETRTATVSVTISPVNDLPITRSDTVNTEEDIAVDIDVVANDVDVDGDSLSVSTVTTPLNGLAVINGNGTVGYTPNSNFNGTDTFNYTVVDGNGGSATDTVTVIVDAVNDPPVANDDSAITDEDVAIEIDVLSNDFDAEGDVLTLISVNSPSKGAATISGPGQVTYTPNTNDVGLDQFTYTISDPQGRSVTAVVTVQILPVNDAPVAANDNAITDEEVAIDIEVTANDFDVDNDPLSVESFTQGNDGAVSLNVDGTLRYQPSVGFSGGDNFSYTITDGNGATATANVNVLVQSTNDAPLAEDDFATTDEDTAVVVQVLDNDTDEDGDPLTLVAVTPGANGIVILNGNGTLTYTPAANFNGGDTFTYTISDGSLTSVGSVTVIVTPINDAPVAMNDSATTAEDLGIVIDALANDFDVDGDSLTITNVTAANNGDVQINGNGTLSYTPNANFNGVDNFSYTISDGNGESASAQVMVLVNSIDDPPTAVADSATTDEDNSMLIAVLANDSDPEGQALTLVEVTMPASGSAVIVGTQVEYTPNPDFNGTDSFIYQVADEENNTATARVTVIVNPINDAPFATADAAVTQEQAAVDVDVLANDLDVDGDTLTILSFTQGTNGAVTSNANGTLRYTPDSDFFGSDSFEYTIDDGNGATATALVSIIVEDVNVAPIAVADNASTDEDTPVSLNLLANDSDADGDPLTVVAISTAANGAVIDNGSGDITYTPNADFFGVDMFQYTLSDGLVTSSATVTLTVNPINDAPVANDDVATTLEDEGVDIAVILNDTDVDGTTRDIVAFTQGGFGSVTDNGNGTLRYTPDANANGTDTFTYTIADGDGETDMATVTVTVLEANDPPEANPDFATTAEDTPTTLAVLDNDTDKDGDTVTVVNVTQPNNGSAAVNGDFTVTYTPAPDFHGLDTFSYVASDGVNTRTALVTVTITPVNDDPVANDDVAITVEDTPVSVAVLANDNDVDGDTLTIASFLQGNQGNVVLNSDGSLEYTPNAEFSGDDLFSYTISDGNGGSATANVLITVESLNDAPVANPDLATTDEDTAVTLDLVANDTDVDGDPLSVASVTLADNGTVVLNADGSVTYTPNGNFNGNDSFDYVVTDGEDTAVGAVAIVVLAVNDAPVANNDSGTTVEDTFVVINVTANDTDLEDDFLTVIAVGSASNGAVEVAGDATVRYTPEEDFIGLDSFTYTVSDGDLTAMALVTVNVTAANDPPTAVDDSVIVDEDDFVIVDVLANDSDVDGDPLTVISVSTPANGTTLLNPGSTITYAPAANFNGADSFTYTISDGNGATATATVMVAVAAVPDAPIVVNDSASTQEDTPVNVDVLANDSDGDGDTIMIVALSIPNSGTALLEGDGTVTYSPNPNFIGTDSFTYTVSDGDPATSNVLGTVSISVNGVNDAPIAVDDMALTDEDMSVIIAVLANDSDPDGDPLVIQNVVLATVGVDALGSVTVNGDGTLTYTPVLNANGVDSFIYTIADDAGATSSATVTVTINAVNDDPVANPDFATTNEDQSINVSVLDNDLDVDGDTLSVVAVSAPLPSGSAVIEANSTVTFTPELDFTGNATFSYTLSDGTTTVDALVTISVGGVNDAPQALDDMATTDEDTAVEIAVLANDSDPEGDTLSLTATSMAANGSLLVVGALITYTPNPDFNGADSFTYTISDGNGGEDTATVTLLVNAVNDAPIAVADDVTTNEDEGVMVDVLANDTDVDGDTLTLVATSTPLSGVVTLLGAGQVQYTPNADFNGADQFDYTISDGTVEVTGTVFLTVIAVNDAPVAVDDTALTQEEFAVTIPVLTNDTDVDGDPLIVINFGTPSNGSVQNPGDGTLVYTPEADFTGFDSFSYTISDGVLASTATVTVNVTNVNDPPIAVDDVATTNEDESVEIDVLGNDSDPEGTPLSVVAATNGSNGSVVLDGNLVVYAPNANYFGSDQFQVTISDGNAEVSSLVTVTVISVNDAPVALDDVASTDEETAVAIAVLDNDSDVEGDPLTLTAFSGAANGEVADPGDGSLVYTPNAEFAGVDSFSYTISDGALTATATVSVTVNAVNDVPVVTDDLASTAEDTPVVIDVLANDVDNDGDPLTVVSFTAAGAGVVAAAGNSLEYTPNANFNGNDSFTYTVSDGTVEVTGTVDVTVIAVNDAPIALDDVAATEEESSVTVDVLANDSDVDADTLTIVSFTQATHGSVTSAVNGLLYTPNADFSGTDSFAYTISDGTGEASATVTVTVAPINDAPIANDDLATTDEEVAVLIDVLANDTDSDGDTLMIVAFSAAANGRVTTVAGSLSYAPDANFHGSDLFTYTMSDGTVEVTAAVTVTVNPVNDAPVANNDNASTDEDTPVTVAVLANDTDVDGDTLTVVSSTDPANGTVDNPGDGTLVYTPGSGFSGVDTFSYTISDGNGEQASANVTIQVALVNEAPVANDDSFATDEDTPITFEPLANDTDADGDTLTLVSFTAAPQGQLDDLGGGVLRYTPNANFTGMDSFSYTISDGLVDATAVVSLVVNPVNDDPVALDDAASTDEDMAVLVSVLNNDSDVDGDALSIATFTSGANGAVTASGGGLLYTPNLDFNGADSFSYTLTDGTVEVMASVAITINPVQDAPVAVDDSAVTDEDTTVVVDVLANDTDADGESLMIVLLNAAANGTVALVAGGIEYSPNSNFAGTDSFTYTITDGIDEAQATVTVLVAPINDAPIAQDDSATTDEDTAVVVDVLANDSDADGDALTISAFSQATNGSVTADANGLRYTPNANFNGGDLFTYTLSDGTVEITANVTLTVVAVNDAPVAADDTVGTEEEVVVVIDVLANDEDVDGDTLTIVAFTDAANGTVVQNSADFTYMPADDFSGTDTFTYTISDGELEATATVTVLVNSVNDAPTAVDDMITIDEDSGTVSITVLDNDSDVDGDPLTVVSFTQPANGTAAADAEGLLYTPDSNFNGTDTFTYTISDGEFEATATVTVVVNSINDAPEALDDVLTTDEDTAATVDVLANDSDVDGDTLIISNFTQPTLGSVTAVVGGLRFTPNANANGADSFTYTVSDGTVEVSATVAVTVNAINDTPELVDDMALTAEDTAVVVDVLANDADADGDTLTISAFGNGAAGSVIPVAGGLEYTPNANFNGTDSFTYTVSDGTEEATALVTISVTPVNDAPLALDDFATTDEDTPVSIDVLANDSDVDGDTLTITSFVQPSNGTVALQGGALLYTPAPEFSGAETFTYTLSDGALEATATVTVTVNPVNDAPVAVDDMAATDEDVSVTVDVLANDSDVDGDPITISAFTSGAFGAVTAVAGGLEYTPNTDANGVDSFTYTVSDGTEEVSATVAVNVIAINDAPIALDDTATTDEDMTVTIDVLANDSDVDGDPLAITTVSTPSDGSVTLVAGGVSYTPDANFNGTDTFSYTISDGTVEATATVTLTVNAINDLPLAVNDMALTNEDTVVVVDVLANDSDADGDPLTISAFSNGSAGSVSAAAGGLEYAPDANFNGTDTFTYTVSDGTDTAIATVTVNVIAINDDPVANDDSATTDEDMAIAIDVLANDTDVDGDTLSITGFATPANGLVEIVGALLNYTPNANFNGTDSFSYTINDGTTEVSALVTVIVTAVNDAPEAVADMVMTNEDTVVVVDVLANDSDADGDPLTISAFSNGSSGSVSAAAGGLEYTPDANFNGTDTFSYTITDGTDTAIATVTVNVIAINDDPVANDDSATTDEDMAIAIDVLANDTDVDGDTLSITGFTTPANGLVEMVGALLNYTPNANFNGNESFSYTVTDGTTEVTALVTVVVNAVNDAPEAVADAADVDEDQSVLIDVLANDVDVDGDPLSVTSLSLATSGSLVLEGNAIRYTPAANFNGSDSFSYTISDGTLEASTTVMVTVSSVNDLPIAMDDFATTDEDVAVVVAVLANDSDDDDDMLSVIAVGVVANGSVTNPGDGTLIYTPASGFNGTDTFTYTISDGNGGEASASVSISVAVVNDAPLAADDAATVDEDASVLIDVLANDSDGDGDTLTIVSNTLAANGTLVTELGGFTYTPDADFNGVDSFTYTISDGVVTATASVTVTVNPVNDAPVAAEDNFQVNLNIDQMVNLAVLDNDVDVDGDALTVVSVTQPACGMVTINVDQVTLNVDLPSCMATQTFSYTVSDGVETATATVTISQEPTPAFDFSLFASDVEVDFDVICDGGVCNNVTVTVPILLQENTASPGFPNNIAAFGLHLEHDATLLSLQDVGVGADLALTNGGSGPDFYNSDMLGDGFTVATIISDTGSTFLQVPTPLEVVEAAYELRGEAVAGNAEAFSTILTWVLPTTTLTVDGYNATPQAIDIAVNLNPVANVADFSFLIPSGSAAYDSTTGAGTFTKTLALWDTASIGSRVPFRGISLGVEHDPTVLAVDSVLEGAAMMALDGGSGPDFFQPEINPDGVPGFVLGVIFNLSNPAFTITAEAPLAMVDVQYSTVPGTLQDNTVGLTTVLSWSNSLGSPPVSNLVVITGGGSINPLLSDGTIFLVPVIAP